MKRICIIGNNNHDGPVTDGGRIKIRLYRNLLVQEGYDAYIVELDGWAKHPFKILGNINRAAKRGETIVVMAGPKGCRSLIPYVYHKGNKSHSRLVFVPLGIGTFDSLLKNKTEKEVSAFLNCESFLGIEDKKMEKWLRGFDAIAPQNAILSEAYRRFYHLNNVVNLPNFRPTPIKPRKYSAEPGLRIVYLSRVKRNKGVFDLIEAVSALNAEKKGVFSLDIYGQLQMPEEDELLFKASMSSRIRYFGEISPNDSIGLLSKYDLFCLPTKYYGEGTSGALIESLIAGTPVLVSSYSQAKHLIKDGQTGFIFELGNVQSLKERLLFLHNEKAKLKQAGIAAQKEAQVFTYEGNRALFIETLTGEHL